MKKTVLSIILSTIVFSGCSHFLDEYNPVGLDTIYDTEDMLESSINGIMSCFVTGNGFGYETPEAFSPASGLVHWSSTTAMNTAKWESALHFTQYSTNDWNGKFFYALYNVVSRANALIEALPSSPVDEEYKKEIEGEAYFYRAVAYFWIVRIWGDCPLKLAVDNTETATACPRTPYYKVYEQIVKDLEYAETIMRSPARVKEVTPNIARPNKYAVTAYLASVYNTIGSLLASPDDNFWNNSKEDRRPDFSALGIDKNDLENGAKQAYSKALSYAERLIPESPNHDSGSPYALVEKHGDLFEFDPEFSRNGYSAYMNPEQIFSVPATVTCGMTMLAVKYCMPEYPAGTSASIANTQYGRYRPSRYLFQRWCSTYPKEKSSMASFINVNTTDPRLDNTMYYGTMRMCNGSGVTGMYPNTLSNAKVSCFPYWKKPASKRYNVNTTDADYILMRLGEIYFIAAEAAAYLDDEAAARKYVEVIHARARHSVADGAADSSMPSWEGKTFSDKQELLDEIFWESEFELAGENLYEYIATHRHGARWIIRNICIPKNEMFPKTYHKDLLSKQYPADFRYPSDDTSDPDETGSDVNMIRRGLLAGFPQNEALFNSEISEVEDRNDYTF